MSHNGKKLSLKTLVKEQHGGTGEKGMKEMEQKSINTLVLGGGGGGGACCTWKMQELECERVVQKQTWQLLIYEACQ